MPPSDVTIAVDLILSHSVKAQAYLQLLSDATMKFPSGQCIYDSHRGDMFQCPAIGLMVAVTLRCSLLVIVLLSVVNFYEVSTLRSAI